MSEKEIKEFLSARLEDGGYMYCCGILCGLYLAKQITALEWGLYATWLHNEQINKLS